ncbi:MAG: OmpA family protein [Candidatus Competibacteraceae bacterium]
MKVRLQKLRLVVAASAVVITAGVYAAEGDMLYVQDGFGGPVKDPFGKCVLSLGGSRVPGCVEEVAVVPPPTPVHETMTLGADTFFDFNKYNLKPAGMAKLDELAAKLQQLGPAVTAVGVTGHTDSVGSEAYNLKLSQRRAQAVADYLVQRGVNPSIIQTRGMGKSNPIASNATPAGRAQNRRVEITVDSVQPSRG